MNKYLFRLNVAYYLVRKSRFLQDIEDICIKFNVKYDDLMCKIDEYNLKKDERI